MLTRRLQILLDEDRYDRLARHAADRGASSATQVREAIDTRFPALDSRRRAAAAILSAAPMDVPEEPADLKRELSETRHRRS